MTSRRADHSNLQQRDNECFIEILGQSHIKETNTQTFLFSFFLIRTIPSFIRRNTSLRVNQDYVVSLLFKTK